MLQAESTSEPAGEATIEADATTPPTNTTTLSGAITYKENRHQQTQLQ